MATFQFVLPPSMMMSPGSPRAMSWSIASVVGSPAGTITHMTRGRDWKFLTNSSTVKAATAPCDAFSLIASADLSYAIMRWPRFIRRKTMLPPMRPRPTIPISICAPLPNPLPCGERGVLLDR